MRFAGLALILLAGCQQPKPLPIYGSVPDFELTAQSGTAFTRKDLEGKIWVADFIYTTCTGPCPLMTRKMRQVQAARPEILLLSFSVDPEHDTPQVLSAYARAAQAHPSWFFLTGDRVTFQTLSR